MVMLRGGGYLKENYIYIAAGNALLTRYHENQHTTERNIDTEEAVFIKKT